MQINFSKFVGSVLAGMCLGNIASAHPGHGPADLAAEVSQPLAGSDHFVAFLALTSVLLIALRFVLKAQKAKRAYQMNAVRKNRAAFHRASH